MKQVLLFTLLALISSSLIAQTSASICPRRANGLIPNPDPTLCTTFYQCANGVATLQTCPWPLVFHADVKGCARPLTGECISPNPICPTDGAHADPNDCSKYFLCSWGMATIMSCPSGTVFNPNGYCDWPANVDCHSYLCDSNHLTDAYILTGGVAYGVTCTAEETNLGAFKAYKYDATGRTFVFCDPTIPMLTYCCGNSHYSGGQWPLCVL